MGYDFKRTLNIFEINIELSNFSKMLYIKSITVVGYINNSSPLAGMVARIVRGA